ncbi:MAG: hypothetical protein M5U01_08410 [Ardenticatenaceae bacterium]|nr:hypothetical protein [Ardenticatenaceae bacterium]
MAAESRGWLAGEIRALGAGSGDPAGAGGVRWLQGAGAGWRDPGAGRRIWRSGGSGWSEVAAGSRGWLGRSGLWAPDLAIRRERVERVG